MRNQSIKAFLIAVILGLPAVSQARKIGVPPVSAQADALCTGGRIAGNTIVSRTEVCVDASGNVVPSSTITARGQNLGLSSGTWRNTETQNINLDSGGNLQIPNAADGNTTIGTAGTQATNGLSGTGASRLGVAGVLSLAKSAVGSSQGGAGGICISTTIPVNSSFETLLSSSPGGMAASTVTITATPSISTTTSFSGSIGIADGTYLVLTGTTTSSVVVLQSSGVLSGSQLRLNASTRAITRGSVLTLIFNAALSLWQEISFVP